MKAMGYVPSLADTDVWMKDMGDHYKYVCVYVDDLIYAGKDPDGFYKALRDQGFTLKGVGHPEFFLRGDFKRIKEPEDILTWGLHTYIN